MFVRWTGLERASRELEALASQASELRNVASGAGELAELKLAVFVALFSEKRKIFGKFCSYF